MARALLCRTGDLRPRQRATQDESHAARRTRHNSLLHDFDSFNDSRAAERLLEGAEALPVERFKDRVDKNKDANR